MRNSGKGEGNQSFCEHEQADQLSWGQVGPVYKSSINQRDTCCLRGEYSKVKHGIADLQVWSKNCRTVIIQNLFTRDKSGLKLGLAKMVLCSPHLKSDWQKEGSGWTLASRLPPKHCIAEPALSAPPTPSPNIHHLHPHASQGQDGKVQLSPHHHCCHIGERLNKNFARVWICSDITIVYRL